LAGGVGVKDARFYCPGCGLGILLRVINECVTELKVHPYIFFEKGCVAKIAPLSKAKTHVACFGVVNSCSAVKAVKASEIVFGVVENELVSENVCQITANLQGVSSVMGTKNKIKAAITAGENFVVRFVRECESNGKFS
jgi:hypothetical protein